MDQLNSQDSNRPGDPLQAPSSTISKSDSEELFDLSREAADSRRPHAFESPLGRTIPSDTTVSKLIQESQSKFNKVIASGSLVHYEHEISSKAWTDELCRFRVWAHNVDLQDGQSTLDDRLSYVPHLQSQTVRLLQSLQELLTDLEDHEADNTGQDSQDDEGEEYGDKTDSINQHTEVQHIFKTLRETISYLNRISAVIPRTEGPPRLPDSLTRQFNAISVGSTGLPQSPVPGSSSVPNTLSPSLLPSLPDSLQQSRTDVNPQSHPQGVALLGTSQGARKSILLNPGHPSGSSDMDKGTKSIDVDDMILRLLGRGNSTKSTKSVCLKNAEITEICSAARELFVSQPMLLELSAPVKVVGDIHGQYPDLIRLLHMCGFPPATNYLFLGDYVDRGKHSLETILLLLCYKLKYPENVFLLRGNHESANINRLYGFYDECKRRCNIKIWKTFIDTFNCLPVASIISGKIFCVHGGLSPHMSQMDDIRDIVRPTEVPDSGLLTDLLWSDPDDIDQAWRPNDRGASYSFGTKVIVDFLLRHDLDLVCRAHQVVEDGYEFHSNRKLVTIFSAPNYCGEFDNSGAVMCVSEDLLCSFQVLKPLDSSASKNHIDSSSFKRETRLKSPPAVSPDLDGVDGDFY